MLTRNPPETPVVAPLTQARVSPGEVVAVVAIFTIAFVARLSAALRGSGLFGLNNYDDGVHFAAAVGLVHGRLPYRDFLLLQPPGIVVALTPFAGLAQLIGDARGFAVARLAFMALGAVNALLVARYLRSIGKFAALSGGLFYALFWPAIYSEQTVLLEGLANSCVLLGLCLPFFVTAPVTMWRMVVLDEMQRNDTGARLIGRVHGISGMSLYHEPDHVLNVLSRNLDRGCPLVVDLGGASYHLDSPDRGVSTQQRNEVFQEYALVYLRTGDSTVIARFRKAAIASSHRSRSRPVDRSSRHHSGQFSPTRSHAALRRRAGPDSTSRSTRPSCPGGIPGTRPIPARKPSS